MATVYQEFLTAVLVLAFGAAGTARADGCREAHIPVCDNLAKKPRPPGDLRMASPLRRQIVATAAKEIGKVSSLVTSECTKHGWQRLEAYYSLARNSLVNDQEREILRRPETAPGQQVKINDWCGIFALWAVKSAAKAPLPTEEVIACQPEDEATRVDYRDMIALSHWDSDGTGLHGLPWNQGAANIQPGDIVVFSGSLSHHAIVERVVGGRIYTIDGNQDCQTIARQDRPISEVYGYYRSE